MSRTDGTDSLSKLYRNFNNPEEQAKHAHIMGEVLRGFESTQAKLLGSKLAKPPEPTATPDAHTRPANMEAIKGKTPSPAEVAKMQVALGGDIYGGKGDHKGPGPSPEAKARADALIDRAGGKEPPPRHHREHSAVAPKAATNMSHLSAGQENGASHPNSAFHTHAAPTSKRHGFA